ncbi:methyl-accepting chemotaxis protein [Vibrio azureus]|uniref:Methyl-accepting chemotaxis protein n=1 Tax=Vibrio azureus NBRC 104587 TaxID=1219077 RepID=U3A3P2_9VIBR|nr:methyl-accepting chemotaxis protein [Vibrio azureus]AUI86108.1 methyl-accepting chemotaxis protein [Vibrio azureus]GAD74631.1 hypothetical protein VAZ01S_013_00380 [Vibrio azureus NBRC 104587]
MLGSPSPSHIFNQFSIRTKFILINAILIVGILFYGAFEQISLNNLHELEVASVQNTAAEVDLLNLRRFEKDFISRHNLKYKTRFDETFAVLSNRLTALDKRLHEHGLQFDGQIDLISSTLNQYRVMFTDLVAQIQLLDSPTSSDSLIQQLTQARQQLKQDIIQLNELQAKVDFSSLMEHDLTYQAIPTQHHQQALLNELAKFQTTYPQQTQLKASIQQYQDDLAQVFQAYQVLGMTPDEGLRGKLRQTVHQTEQEILSLQDEIETAILDASNNVKNQLHLFGALIAITISVLLAFIGRSIILRIRAINTMMQEIANGNGDLTLRMNPKGNDELAQLGRSFDQFIDKVHGLIKEAASVKEVLLNSSSESEHAAENSIKNAEQQKIESESVATAINELVETSNEITRNIEYAASHTSEIKEASHCALKITHQASDSMHSLASNIINSQELIQQLEEQSREINSVISTIQTIAEQTNLLALNAAIEAARAGEYGRGFAVVADEVRDLSMKTDQSTRQIETTISNLTDQVHRTVSLMSESQSQAEATQQETKQVVSAIDSMNQQIEDLFDLNAQIATASEQQSVVSGDIDRNVTQISSLANDTHREIQSSVTCTKQVSQVSLKLDAIVTQFRY